jgi:biopolymer transport protein ExbD
MKFNLDEEDKTDVSLTPLIDVVFLLLIFFMVTTTFDNDASLKIELPKASNTVQSQEEKNLEVVIDRKGQYYMDGKTLLDGQSRTLESALSKLTKKYSVEKITIRADAQTPHQSVVSVMDAAGKIGINKVFIATSSEQNDSQK